MVEFERFAENTIRKIFYNFLSSSMHGLCFKLSVHKSRILVCIHNKRFNEKDLFNLYSNKHLTVNNFILYALEVEMF